MIESFGGAWSAKVIVPAPALEAFERAFEGLAGVVSLYEWDESRKPVLWAVEGMFNEAPPRAELTSRVALAAVALGISPPELVIAKVPAKDWLTETVASFPPLRAGRYYIHGDHITGPFPASALRLKINAATAFGSGQHASTMGCLLALDGLFRREDAAGKCALRGLDMGCGTGILGMAAAKTRHMRVICADIDPEAVRVTRYNARRNALKGLISPVLSDGCGDRHIRRHGPYDIVTANILARPLNQMAADLSTLLRPGGYLIVAGFIRRDEYMVLTAYRMQGLRLERRIRVGTWSTLVLRR
jgi:ribosomal protein L11 methyltransferase